MLFFSSTHADQILTRQQQWNLFSDEVKTWVDSLGLPIDSEIEETVVALNLLGIPTIASCGGHLDHSFAYPWIDIRQDTSEINCLEIEEESISNQLSLEEKYLEELYPDFSWPERWERSEAQLLLALFKQKFEIRNQLDALRESPFKSINLMLMKFYQSRVVVYDRILVIHSGRLQSIGSAWEPLRSTEEREAKLIEYREEMKSFTEFLKVCFFEKESS